MAQVIWNSDIDVYDPKVIPVLVARNIACYLNVQDLVEFAQVSRNTWKVVNDANLWVRKLQEMEVWANAETKEGPVARSQLNESHPLRCFDGIVKNKKAAKYQVLQIHRALWPYYSDLQSNKPYEQLRIFLEFQTPEQQLAILQNLLRYNKIDYVDETRLLSQNKINSILEIFENALLRELEIHFDLQEYDQARQFVKILVDLRNEQTLIDFFLQKTIFDNEESEFFNLEAFDTESLFIENEKWEMNRPRFEDFIDNLAKVFNEEAHIIDQIFPQSIPMMYKVGEELVSNKLIELVMLIIDLAKSKSLYLEVVPYVYELLSHRFIGGLGPCENVGESYPRLIQELIDMLYEPYAAEYMREEVFNFKTYADDKIRQWNDTISKREEETTQSIWKHVKVESKNDFLTSFKKVFIINQKTETQEETAENYSEVQAKAKILSENIKSLNKIFSPELALAILNEAKLSLSHLMKFTGYTVAELRNDIYLSMQDVFMKVLDAIGGDHLKPGFTKALEYIKNYNPKDMTNFNVDPLVLFFDLINVADLIIQMIDIFYKEEMIHKKAVRQENSILNPSLQSKKKLEGIVDKYVADGLNVGIDILMNDIETTLKTALKNSDYNPPAKSLAVFDGPTEAARKVVAILDENIDLLVGSADKLIVEVFQQEVAERFFQIIVKTLKKSTISVAGAINLISDLNLYHDFIFDRIRSNKKLVMPLFQSLKKVGSIYLIGGNDSKSIGKLVSDLSKFNGIFGQEEIYEFVQRREDWPTIKRDVEKVMYGLSLGDCRII